MRPVYSGELLNTLARQGKMSKFTLCAQHCAGSPSAKRNFTGTAKSLYAGFGGGFLAAFAVASCRFRNPIFSCSRFRTAAASARSLAAAARCRPAAVAASASSAACDALASQRQHSSTPAAALRAAPQRKVASRLAAASHDGPQPLLLPPNSSSCGCQQLGQYSYPLVHGMHIAF